MKKIHILLSMILLFVPCIPALAAFGVSPTYFRNSELYPGQDYEKIINLLRTNDSPLETARIEYAVGQASDWFSADEKNPIVLDSGTVRKPVKIKISVPSKAKPGTYSGKINIFLSAGNRAGSNVVLGISIKTQIIVLEKTALGSILLQVEKNGEAWYISPSDRKKYYLGNPSSAFGVMKNLSIGARHAFFGVDKSYPNENLGKIYLDIEDHGRAYYINPRDRKAYYLGCPQDAFRVMSMQGQGATDAALDKFKTGSVEL
jgi:hypothetical protein